MSNETTLLPPEKPEGNGSDPQFDKLRNNAFYITNHYYDLNNTTNPWVVSGEASFDAIFQAGNVNDNIVQQNARRVRQIELDKIADVFESPTNYTQAQLRLIDGRIIILLGASGSGKHATALHLAHDRSGPNVFEMSPRQVLADLLDFATDHDSATFIIDGAAAYFLKDVQEFDLRALRDRLQERDTFLIVTTKELHRQHAFQDLIVHIDEPPQRIEPILERHLDFYSVQEHIDVALAYQIVKDQAIATKLLAHDTSFRRIDETAWLITQVASQRITLDEALNHMSVVDQDYVQRIFLEECKTTRERTFLIALAAFSGAPETSVNSAARLLQYLMPEIGIPRPADVPIDPMEEERLLYTKCHGQRIKLKVNTDLSIQERDGLALESAKLGPAILGYIWQHHPTLRNTLLNWLRVIGQTGYMNIEAVERVLGAIFDGDSSELSKELEQAEQHQEMRVRAAAAVGELMRYDFTSIRREIIHPWVKRGGREMHLLVAIALMVPLWDENHRNTVLRLVYTWRRQFNSRRQHFFHASLIAYTQVGFHYLEEALKNLGEAYCDVYELVIDGQKRLKLVLDAIVDAIGIIAQSGKKDGEIILGLIQFCDLWTQDERKPLHILAAFAFLEIAKVSVREPKTDRNWPAPLVVAARNKDDCNRIAHLFLNAMDHYGTYLLANDLFINWGESAGRDWQRLARTFDHVIRAMYDQGNDTDQKRLERLMSRESRNAFFLRFLE